MQRDQIIWFRALEYKCLHIGFRESDLERFWYLQTLFESLYMSLCSDQMFPKIYVIVSIALQRSSCFNCKGSQDPGQMWLLRKQFLRWMDFRDLWNLLGSLGWAMGRISGQNRATSEGHIICQYEYVCVETPTQMQIVLTSKYRYINIDININMIETPWTGTRVQIFFHHRIFPPVIKCPPPLPYLACEMQFP